jgi:hypothetical protein
MGRHQQTETVGENQHRQTQAVVHYKKMFKEITQLQQQNLISILKTISTKTV